MTETLISVGDLVRMGRARTPQRVAAKMRGGRAVTYTELDERTDRLANALLANGLQKGDRVAAWLEDCLEYLELYVAVGKAGLVLVPINARYVAEEARHNIIDSGARAFVWSMGLGDRVAQLDLGPDLLRVTTYPGADGTVEFEALVVSGSTEPPVAPAGDDLYVIGYTSGTTGRPKGAMLTHSSVIAIARMHASAYRLPMYSIGALTGSMSFVATVPAHPLHGRHDHRDGQVGRRRAAGDDRAGAGDVHLHPYAAHPGLRRSGTREPRRLGVTAHRAPFRFPGRSGEARAPL
jgi:fatty-acyl-CoA synthase